MSDVGRLVADRYRLVEHIGSGAMGVVWQAHDERLHRTVALKQLLLQPGLSKADANEARERAMREGRIAARLQHPNAVSVYDVVEDDGQPVLIMEYVPSSSLSAALDERGPMAPVEVARVGAQVATALTAAHAAGIVHRDIKPGNVLLANDGNVKITDFGISRATGDVTVTATGMLAGTPAYLAPEVAKGENPGPPSDVFSLASTLYAAVEGQPPFGFIDNTLALLHAVAACRTVPPKQAGPLTGLLNHMLRANPTERPSMPEVTQALNAIAAGQATPARGFAAGPNPIGPPSGPMRLGPLGGPGGPSSGPNRLDSRSMDETTQRTRLGPPPPGYRPPPQPARAGMGNGMNSGMNTGMNTAMHPGMGSGGHPVPGAASEGPPWRKWLLTALAIVVAAVIGIVVANFFTNTGDNASASSLPATVPSVVATGAPAATTPAAPATTITTTTQEVPTNAASTTTIAPASFAAMRNALLAYYSLLPKQPQTAWGLLSPAAQAASKGYADYAKGWAAVSATQVAAVVPHGPNAVLARVTLLMTNKKTTTTNYLVGFVQDNGQLLLNNAQQVGKVQTSSPTTTKGKGKGHH